MDEDSTRDLVHRVKWPHEMVFSSQGKAPTYEDMSLALFTYGYLAIMTEEGPLVKGYMLYHSFARIIRGC